MAREEKRFELRPVDDEAVTDEPIFRLQSDGTSVAKTHPIRVEPAPEAKRLELPGKSAADGRTPQQGLKALMDQEPPSPELVEQGWTENPSGQKPLLWGWFALIGLLIAGALVWSLSHTKKAGGKIAETRAVAVAVLEEDAREDAEAARLIDRIHSTIHRYQAARSIPELLPLIRQPERVRPLMEHHYGGQTIPPAASQKIELLQPTTLETRAEFWIASAGKSQDVRALLIEIDPQGEPRIDWETAVNFQPMKWDAYVRERPAGTSLDFRVHVEPDHFFSHEFADDRRWTSFRLTTLDGEETLFGYAKQEGDIAKTLLDLIGKNGGRKTALILRLGLPQGLQSRRGVVIEKVLSPRWIYLDPPDPGS